MFRDSNDFISRLPHKGRDPEIFCSHPSISVASSTIQNVSIKDGVSMFKKNMCFQNQKTHHGLAMLCPRASTIPCEATIMGTLSSGIAADE